MARFSFGVVLVGILCTLCGLGMTGVSSWILHKTLQMQKNANLDHAKGVLEQLENFSGVKTGLHNNFEPIFRILISTSAAALAGGCVQFITSFCLLLCGVSGKLKRAMAMLWVAVEILCLLCIGGAVLCILTNELKMNDSLQIFMISAGADVVIIIASCVILACSECHGSSSFSSDRKGGAVYSAVGKKSKFSAPSKEMDSYTNGVKNSNGGGYDNGNMNLSVQDQVVNYESKKQWNSHGVPVLPMAGRPSSVV